MQTRPRSFIGHSHSHDDIGMTAEILCGSRDRDIRAEIKRPVKNAGSPCVVGDNDDTQFMRKRRNSRQIDDVVGHRPRALDIDKSGIVPDFLGYVAAVRAVDRVSDSQPGEFVRHESSDRFVHGIAHQDVIARAQEASQHHGDRCLPGGEQVTAKTALQCLDQFLKRHGAVGAPGAI